jgi:hypothetical protein
VRRRELVAALALLVVAPAPAAAAGPDGGSTLSGGWAGEPERLLLRAEADAAGQAVTLDGWLTGRCGAGALRGAAAVAADGAVAAEGVTRSGRTVVTWRLAGGFELYRGRGRLDATIRRGRRSCVVAGLPWALENASSEHQVGPGPDPGSRWHGDLAGGMVALVVAEPATRVRLLTFSVDMRFCPRRPGDRLVALMHDLPIEDRTDFHDVERHTVRAGGLVRRIRLEASGYFFSDGLSLTIAVREVARSARTGRRAWACDTLQLSGNGEDLD